MIGDGEAGAMEPRQSQGERMRARGDRWCTYSQRPRRASGPHPCTPSSEAGGMLGWRPCAAWEKLPQARKRAPRRSLYAT
jgi:hypothetical protein